MHAFLLVLAVVAALSAVAIGVLLAFANMMSDAPTVQMGYWPVAVAAAIAVALFVGARFV